jgi:glycosyltransferase involved in cell wall biosynthesis
MRIAYIGQKGIPATFGGIERHVHEVSTRLAARGHEVVVWCRDNYSDRSVVGDEFEGVHLRYLPTVATRRLEASIPSALAAARSMRGFDIVHFHAIGPGFASILPRIGRRAGVVQAIHGLDHERDKWSPREQAVLRVGAWLSARVPHETVVVSKALREHYRERYGRQATLINYGVTHPEIVPPGPLLESLGLRRGQYALFVGRLVPEKGIDLLLRAFREVPDPDARLVLAGGSSHTDGYVAELEAIAATDPRILLLGYRFGEELGELYSNAGAFVTASFLEGLPLTLLEAASYGLPIVASDIAPHGELLTDSRLGHLLVPTGEEVPLTEAIAATLAGGSEVEAAAGALRDHVHEDWTWDRCVDEHEQLYERLVARKGRSGR